MRKRWAAGAGVALAVLTLAFVYSMRPPADSGPHGTRALFRFLDGMGLSVRKAEAPPAGGVFALMADLRDDAQAGLLLDWAGGGGKLVVADPASAVAQRLGVTPDKKAGGLGPDTSMKPGCAAPEAAGVDTLTVSSADFALEGPARSVSCFVGPKGPFVVAVRHGKGVAIVLGGRSPLTNQYLLRAGNARFAYRLFSPVAPGAPVIFGPALPAAARAASMGPWESLPLPAKAAIIQICIVVVVFALVRGRRFGRPVVEEPVSPIPSSLLVQATASLYRTARVAGYAGGLLRRAVIRRTSRLLGLHETETDALAAALANMGSMSQSRVGRALVGDEPKNDDELIALGRELEEISSKAMGVGTK